MDHTPIAATYKELQALHVLDAFFQSLDTLAEDSDRLMAIGIFCIDLILENATHMHDACHQELSREQPDKRLVSQRGIWTRDILYLAVEIARCIRREALYSDSSERDWPQMNKFLKSKERVDSALLKSLPKGDAMQSILHASTQLDPVLNIVQNWKTINQLLFLLQAQISSVPFTDTTLAVGRTESAVRCVNEGISPTDKTFLRQFRLLHQIPELLGREFMRYINRFRTKERGKQRSAETVLVDLGRCNVFLRLMIEAAIPLANELTPNSYYEIRSRLGITSGSQSEVIAHQILSPSTTKYIIAKQIRSRKKCARSARSIIVSQQTGRELAEILEQIQSWRDLHAMFPRNVLGAGAVSLIGTPDATKYIEAKSIHGAELASNAQLGRASASETKAKSKTTCPAIAQLDDYLLSIVGTCTAMRYPDVQQRRGYFSKGDKGNQE